LEHHPAHRWTGARCNAVDVHGAKLGTEHESLTGTVRNVGYGFVATSRYAAGAGNLAVALATLSAAAVFQPLRRRVQDRVDRRFNRSRTTPPAPSRHFGRGYTRRSTSRPSVTTCSRS
jgi:hypothetical protein